MQVLDFKPETGSSNLRYADFSSNLIATIAPIVHFSRLEHLNLERNQLRVLRGEESSRTASAQGIRTGGQGQALRLGVVGAGAGDVAYMCLMAGGMLVLT